MSHKNTSRVRRLISLDVKKEIIYKRESGRSLRDLSLEYGMAKSTICTILKNKEGIKCAEFAKGIARLSSSRCNITEQMETLLLAWIKDVQQITGVGVSEAIICEKAKQLFEELEARSPSTSNGAVKEFFGTKGWLAGFRRRTGFNGAVENGEVDDSGSADRDAAEQHTVSPSSSNQLAAEPILRSPTNAAASRAPTGQSSHIDEEAIKMWTKGEITMWLTKYSLENSCLLYLSGEELIFLHKLRREAPEFFYHCLETKLHLESLLDLSRATEALADLTW